MTRVLRILAALAMLAAVTGAKGCVESNRPTSERKCPLRDRRDVYITADSKGPYTILVVAQDEKSGIDRTGPEPIAAGEYKQTLCYPSGARITVSVSVRGNGTDDIHCKVKDGPHEDERSGKSDILCKLTTSR